MAYRKSVYIKAKSILEQRRKKAENERAAHHSAAILRCPEIVDIEREMASYGMSVIKAVALKQDPDEYINELSKKSLEAQKRRKEALKKAGFPEDYLDVRYHCPICQDTGEHDGYYCRCYTELLRQTAKNELPVASQLSKCTFENFNPDYYPDVFDEELGITCREQMKNAFEYCRDYARYFSKNSGGIIMIGRTGLGKTYLSLAIAGQVIDKGYDVYYNSVQNIMDKLQKEHFSRIYDEEESLAERLCNCDLLILDDLGAEFSTQFTNAEICNMINTRIGNERPTIISTNLTMHQIEEKYSERVASRICGSCVPLYFCGRDIRQLKND